MIQLFFISVLLHIIDDFVCQPICLSKLKQKVTWEELGLIKTNPNDYKCALIIHGISWSIMTFFPLIVFINTPLVYTLIVINAIIHSAIDNLKANLFELSLTEDQSIHFVQILVTYVITYLSCV